jgi:uncharacterized protein (DUF736 family)
MNIGSIKQNDNGIYMGRISTLAVAMTIALRAEQPEPEGAALRGPRARPQPQLGAGRRALRAPLEQHRRSSSTAASTTPSLAAPLQVSCFRQDDGSYNVVWSRPTRRRDVSQQLAAKTDELPPFGDDAGDAGDTSGAPADGLGDPPPNSPADLPGCGRDRPARLHSLRGPSLPLWRRPHFFARTA